ncbi:MAG: nitroreductase family protein [Clostridia bacterium]|nr:nitroreductase family protein [Clostridia bacterium]
MSIDCIMNRRSVRTFTADPVSDEDIRTLLSAGMAAPSAKNMRPWEFIVVRDPERRSDLAALCPYWKPAASAPVVIVVCGNTTSGDPTVLNYYVQDCSCASENILCAAAGINLGGVWLGVYGEEDRMLNVANLLHLPDGVYAVSLLAIGHPEHFAEPHHAYDEDSVHQETY